MLFPFQSKCRRKVLRTRDDFAFTAIAGNVSGELGKVLGLMKFWSENKRFGFHVYLLRSWWTTICSIESMSNANFSRLDPVLKSPWTMSAFKSSSTANSHLVVWGCHLRYRVEKNCIYSRRMSEQMLFELHILASIATFNNLQELLLLAVIVLHFLGEL